jgi:hypothetical protein
MKPLALHEVITSSYDIYHHWCRYLITLLLFGLYGSFLFIISLLFIIPLLPAIRAIYCLSQMLIWYVLQYWCLLHILSYGTRTWWLDGKYLITTTHQNVDTFTIHTSWLSQESRTSSHQTSYLVKFYALKFIVMLSCKLVQGIGNLSWLCSYGDIDWDVWL